MNAQYLILIEQLVREGRPEDEIEAIVGRTVDEDGAEATLARLIEREYAARHPNRPGERGERFAQLLGSSQAEAPPEHAESPWADDAGLESRIARLEDEVARLWDALEGREN